MTKKQGWLKGRTRAVRVLLTDDEHALVRQAAALADRSVSKFSIESIVYAATNLVAAFTDKPPAGKRRKAD